MAVRPLPFLPVEELEGRPHVLVDGASRPGSVLTLSHWPASPTPAALRRDLSAQIVFAYLHAASGEPVGNASRRAEAEVASAVAAANGAEAVSNDHFDEDGLVSVFAMSEPERAFGQEDLLVEVASCGDFGVVGSRRAACIAFAIGPLGEEGAAEPVSPAWAERPGSWSGPRYRAALDKLPELLERPERFRRYWEEDDAALSASLEDLRAGRVLITEVPEVDLAVVTRVASARRPQSAGSAVEPAGGPAAVHEVAVHSSTPATRILAFGDGRCELYLRYEGWVRFLSRKVALRPDLAPLAERLSAAEPAGIGWQADGIGTIVTRMRPEPDAVTDLAPADVEAAVVEYLRTAAPAWDPFRRAGALIPPRERRRARRAG